MQILELEEKYSELKSDLSGQHSKRTRILKISGYLECILSYDTHTIEPYIVEFIPEFLLRISTLEIRGLNPLILQNLKAQLRAIKNLNISEIIKSDIEKSLSSLDGKIILMDSWLKGETSNLGSNKIYFPVLEKEEDDFGFGYLESINIEIKRGEQKIHISPSDLENDEQLEKQIELCLNTAIDYCKKFAHKIKHTHTIYLHFESKLGFYTGNSLGIALALAFIESILKYYNSATVVNINRCIAVTGGVDYNSKILPTSKAIIETKLETVFFSDVQIFCLSKIDELWADEKLKELKTKYPDRDLKIIGLTDLDDLLDRRKIVDIRKQKVVVRTSKFVRKNWISAVATVLLAILFAYLFVVDFDNNPAILTSDGSTLYIKNKNGKLLWTKIVNTDKVEIQTNRSKNAKIVDIDNDGRNELILCNVSDKITGKSKNPSLIICYDYKGKEFWQYDFQDSVRANREILNTEYGTTNILDTLTYMGTKSIFLFSSNGNSFSSALYCLDLKTGKRLPGTFWASGHIMDGVIIDIHDDGKPDIVGVGYENGYEDFVFFVFEIDTLTKVRPTTEDYLIRGYPFAKMKSYIRLPKTDFDNYFKDNRTPGYMINSFLSKEKELKFIFATSVPHYNTEVEIGYEIYYNYKDIDVVIGSSFRVQRDTLVAHHKLDPPYTDTEEYKNIIKSNILYWKDGKWVKKIDLE